MENEREREQFVDALLAALRAEGKWARVEFEPSTFALRLYAQERAAAPSMQSFLAGCFRQYATAPPEGREAVLRHWVTNVFAGELFSEAPAPHRVDAWSSRVLPRVCDRVFWSISDLKQMASGITSTDKVTRMAMGGPLALALCEDLPNSVRYVTAAELEKRQIGWQELYKVARDNLHKLTPTARFSSPSRGVFVSEWKDSHDATRILLGDMLRSLPIRGAPVAFLPSPDSLIVTGDKDDAGIAAAADLALRVLTAAEKPLCGTAVHDAGDARAAGGPVLWEPLDLPERHPSRAAVALLRMTAESSEYATQKSLLDAMNQRDGKDVFVATYTLVKGAGGEPLSFCAWGTAGSFLPMTDLVYLSKAQVGADGTPRASRAFLTTRQAIERVLGPLDVVKALCPQRSYVDFFPTDAQMDAIEKLKAAPPLAVKARS